MANKVQFKKIGDKIVVIGGPSGGRGARGATGATGATGGEGVLSQWAYAYTKDAQVIAANDDVEFTEPLIVVGSITTSPATPPAKTIVIGEGNFYKITYSVSGGPSAYQFALAIDGVVDTSTIYGVAVGGEQLNGQCILYLDAGKLLTLRNVSTGAVTLITPQGGLNPNITASIIIEKMPFIT
jgi:hypothetical protein